MTSSDVIKTTKQPSLCQIRIDTDVPIGINEVMNALKQFVGLHGTVLFGQRAP